MFFHGIRSSGLFLLDFFLSALVSRPAPSWLFQHCFYSCVPFLLLTMDSNSSYSSDLVMTKLTSKNFVALEFYFRVFIQAKVLFGWWVLCRWTSLKGYGYNSRDVVIHTSSPSSMQPGGDFLNWNGIWSPMSRLNVVLKDTIYAGFVALWLEQDHGMSSTISATTLKEICDDHQQSWVVWFLMMLRPEFDHVLSNILNRKALPIEIW